MKHFEAAFLQFNRVREKLAADGVGLNIKEVGNMLDQGLDTLAEAMKAPASMGREVVQIAVARNVYALCSDGSIVFLGDNGKWLDLPGVPAKELKQ